MELVDLLTACTRIGRTPDEIRGEDRVGSDPGQSLAKWVSHEATGKPDSSRIDILTKPLDLRPLCLGNVNTIP